MENLADNLMSFLIYPPNTGWLFTIKAAFIGASVFMAAVIVYCLMRCSYLKFMLLWDIPEFLTYRPFGLKRIEKAWNKVVSRLDSGLESEYKLAVVEADNMMDGILKRMGYGGENLGERLRNLTPATISNLEEIKEVHQIRNSIVRDPSYTLTLDEARRITDVYRKGFEDLQAF